MISLRKLQREPVIEIRKANSADELAGIGYLTHAEIAFLKELAQEVPVGGCIVNVGSGAGTSALAFTEARDDVTLYSVDKDRRMLSNEENALKRALRWDDRKIWQICGESHQVGTNWLKIKRPGNRHMLIDFIFIDDGHLAHEIRGDIENWLPNVMPTGIMVFHDYGSPFWADVKVVVDELMNGKKLLGQVDTVIAFGV